MKIQASITIPYAVANYAEMRDRGFYYVDKTDYIPRLEAYKAPVFLRPRRFGKSLLVSTLAHYYDRTLAHRFEDLFGGTYIGSHPTPEHNRYMIIRYDFSAYKTPLLSVQSIKKRRYSYRVRRIRISCRHDINRMRYKELINCYTEY